MNFLEIAKERYSSRKYQNKKIEKEKLLKVLEAGRVAPSAVNFQPWHFIVIQDEGNKQEICKAYKRDWIKKAPAIIIACGEAQKAWTRKEDDKNHCDIDIAITIDHMTLQATELGLATCWVCNFEVEKAKEILNLPEGIEPIVMLPIGYPEDSTNPNRHNEKRKPLTEIVHWESFDLSK